ncbi:MAG: hypothetical protein R2991_01820 [Thermoanaerobaculia bacterium]
MRRPLALARPVLVLRHGGSRLRARAGRRGRGRRLAALAGCVVLVACAADGSGRHEPPQALRLSGAPAVLEPDRPVHSLTLEAPAAQLEGGRLVEIDLTEIANPTDLRLSFEVRYRPPAGEERLLGSFAPFPPHNPGTFLVPTRGDLAPGGTLELRMILLDEPREDDELHVVVDRIALRRD